MKSPLIDCHTDQKKTQNKTNQARRQCLPVGVEQKALDDEDVSLLLLIVRLWDDVGIQSVINAMRLLELHRIVQPCVDGAHHGIHIQSSDD